MNLGMSCKPDSGEKVSITHLLQPKVQKVLQGLGAPLWRKRRACAPMLGFFSLRMFFDA